jgi:citrate lyase subunit beta/citryl-CoA lyase
VLIPKVSHAETLVAAGMRLRRLKAADRTRVWAMIETPMAILHMEDIAQAAHDVDTRLSCLVMGTNDLAKETRAGLGRNRAAMMPWLMNAVLAARAYGLDILDGVYNALSDKVGFVAECEQGRDCGFDGKTLIHPDQIAAANAIYAPSAEETDHARAIIAAFALPENAGRGAIALDGRMVERLHADMARTLLERAEAIKARGEG